MFKSFSFQNDTQSNLTTTYPSGFRLREEAPMSQPGAQVSLTENSEERSKILCSNIFICYILKSLYRKVSYAKFRRLISELEDVHD